MVLNGLLEKFICVYTSKKLDSWNRLLELFFGAVTKQSISLFFVLSVFALIMFCLLKEIFVCNLYFFTRNFIFQLVNFHLSSRTWIIRVLSYEFWYWFKPQYTLSSVQCFSLAASFSFIKNWSKPTIILFQTVFEWIQFFFLRLKNHSKVKFSELFVYSSRCSIFTCKLHSRPSEGKNKTLIFTNLGWFETIRES